MTDCCPEKAAARNAGMFEGPVGDHWFHDHGPPCQEWPKVHKRLRIRLIFAWYDLWIGLFIDKPKSRAFLFLVPMIGILIEYKEKHRG